MKDKVILTYCCVCICVCACVCVGAGGDRQPQLQDHVHVGQCSHDHSSHSKERSCWGWFRPTPVSLFEHEQINHRWCHVRAEIVVFWSSGEALRCHMGEVWRILQQEEHDHVWRHWTELPHEPTEWTKGREPTLFFYYILCLTFSCSSCSYTLVLQNTEYVLSFRSDPSWRLTWTERRTESSINWLSTLKK